MRSLSNYLSENRSSYNVSLDTLLTWVHGPDYMNMSVKSFGFPFLCLDHQNWSSETVGQFIRLNRVSNIQISTENLDSDCEVRFDLGGKTFIWECDERTIDKFVQYLKIHSNY